MCSHYQAVRDTDRLRRHFAADTGALSGGTVDVWPGYLAAFIRSRDRAAAGEGAAAEREAMLGSFGLIPHWAADRKIARHTYNARSETVAGKPSFRDAWRRAQHCIIPADAFFEPDWRSGRAVPARISRADGRPMGIAGLWSSWQPREGPVLHSFTMLSINADRHALMRQFHKPADEKRMVVILPEDRYDDWLRSDARHSVEFLQPYPAAALQADRPLPQAPTLLDG